MGFNVTGKEVATGMHDPLIMFYVVAGIFIIGFIFVVLFYIIEMLGGK